MNSIKCGSCGASDFKSDDSGFAVCSYCGCLLKISKDTTRSGVGDSMELKSSGEWHFDTATSGGIWIKTNIDDDDNYEFMPYGLGQSNYSPGDYNPVASTYVEISEDEYKKTKSIIKRMFGK